MAKQEEIEKELKILIETKKMYLKLLDDDKIIPKSRRLFMDEIEGIDFKIKQLDSELRKLTSGLSFFNSNNDSVDSFETVHGCICKNSFRVLLPIELMLDYNDVTTVSFSGDSLIIKFKNNSLTLPSVKLEKFKWDEDDKITIQYLGENKNVLYERVFSGLKLVELCEDALNYKSDAVQEISLVLTFSDCNISDLSKN